MKSLECKSKYFNDFFHTIVQIFTKIDGFHVYEGIGGKFTLARVLTFGGTWDS
jgi:hypothetical protein